MANGIVDPWAGAKFKAQLQQQQKQIGLQERQLGIQERVASAKLKAIDDQRMADDMINRALGGEDLDLMEGTPTQKALARKSLSMEIGAAMGNAVDAAKFDKSGATSRAILKPYGGAMDLDVADIQFDEETDETTSVNVIGFDKNLGKNVTYNVIKDKNTNRIITKEVIAEKERPAEKVIAPEDKAKRLSQIADSAVELTTLIQVEGNLSGAAAKLQALQGILGIKGNVNPDERSVNIAIDKLADEAETLGDQTLANRLRQLKRGEEIAKPEPVQQLEAPVVEGEFGPLETGMSMGQPAEFGAPPDTEYLINRRQELLRKARGVQ